MSLFSSAVKIVTSRPLASLLATVAAACGGAGAINAIRARGETASPNENDFVSSDPFDKDPSLRHRELWNKLAAEHHKFRWVRDGGVRHQIDGDDLEMNGEVLSPNERGIAIAKVDMELEARRVKNLQTSLDLLAPYETNPDVSSLLEADREVIRRMMPAFPLMKELDRDLKDFRGAAFRAYLTKHGDSRGLRQFDRLSSAICSPALGRLKGAEPEFCSPIDFFPNERPQGSYFSSELIPTTVTDQDQKRISKAVTGEPMWNPYLVPNTAIFPDPSKPSGWGWRKFNQDPRVRERVEKIAWYLRYAAETPGADPADVRYLKVFADSITNGDPFSSYHEDDAWVKQRAGRLEFLFVVGAGYSPMSKACAFGVRLAVERKGDADFFKQHLLPLLPKLDRMMAEGIGGGLYEARKIPTDSPVRMVDVIAATDASPFPFLAFVGPDTGPVAMRGEVKRVIGANHFEAKADRVLMDVARLALVPEQIPYVTKEHLVTFGAAHEIAGHPIGPRPDHLAAGSSETVKNALGADLFERIEESKSNIGGQIAVAEANESGDPAIDNEYVKKTWITYVASLVRQMRFGGRGHGGGAAGEMGSLFREEGVTLRKVTINGEEQWRLAATGDRPGEPGKKFWFGIGRWQAKGDKAAVEGFFTKGGDSLPPEIDTIFDRINAAGVPVDVVIKYPDLEKLFGPPSYPPANWKPKS